jgi:ADP-heptose:LPS heptosyltransferase
LLALVPGSVVAPSVLEGRRVWEHLVESTRAPHDDRAIRVATPVPAALVEQARHELRRLGWNGTDRLLIVHPGAGGQGKRWPAAGFAAVLERLRTLPGVAIAVHQGPADLEAVAALPEALIVRAIALREPPLPRLAGLLAHAAAYLGNDSGISHLAAAVGRPSIVLFDAERLIWRPWAEHVEPLVVSRGRPREADIARIVAKLTSVLR